MIEGKSFLHNQVRRMIGAATSVATKKISIDHISDLLEVPYLGWDTGIYVGDPNGLYLANIEYKKGVLDLATDSYLDMLDIEKIKISNFEGISEHGFNSNETSISNGLYVGTS